MRNDCPGAGDGGGGGGWKASPPSASGFASFF